jgi:hypothetical protein
MGGDALLDVALAGIVALLLLQGVQVHDRRQPIAFAHRTLELDGQPGEQGVDPA